MVYGGWGYDWSGNGTPTDFIFPGDPNDPASWTMYALIVNWGVCMNSVSSVLIGDLAADSIAIIETAFSYHRDDSLDHLQNVTYGYDRVTQLQQLYGQHFADACTYSMLACDNDCVWPGDMNRDGIVNHLDLLPLGVGWDGEGLERLGPVTWAPHDASDWNVSFDNTYDFKHLDANGDGLLNSLDFNVLNTFYENKTPFYTAPADEFSVGDGLWLSNQSLTSPDNIQPGNFAGPRIRIANAPDLYGVAFELEYDTAYWTQGNGFNPGVSQALQIKKQFPGRIQYAFVFQYHNTVFQYNQLLTVGFLKAKSILSSLPDTTFVRLKNIRGIRADGSEIPLGANRLRYCFGGGCPPSTGVHETTWKEWEVFPNPAAAALTLLAPGRAWQNIQASDLTGRLLRRWDAPGQDQTELDLSGLPAGWLLLRVQGRDWAGVQRVLVAP